MVSARAHSARWNLRAAEKGPTHAERGSSGTAASASGQHRPHTGSPASTGRSRSLRSPRACAVASPGPAWRASCDRSRHGPWSPVMVQAPHREQLEVSRTEAAGAPWLQLTGEASACDPRCPRQARPGRMRRRPRRPSVRKPRTLHRRSNRRRTKPCGPCLPGVSVSHSSWSRAPVRTRRQPRPFSPSGPTCGRIGPSMRIQQPSVVAAAAAAWRCSATSCASPA